MRSRMGFDKCSHNPSIIPNRDLVGTGPTHKCDRGGLPLAFLDAPLSYWGGTASFGGIRLLSFALFVGLSSRNMDVGWSRILPRSDTTLRVKVFKKTKTLCKSILVAEISCVENFWRDIRTCGQDQTLHFPYLVKLRSFFQHSGSQ